MIEINNAELLGADYKVELKRPDGSIVRVLIPREDVESFPNRCTQDPTTVFGLNLVVPGHYS